MSTTLHTEIVNDLLKLAVESGAFPLYEVEDGRRYTLNEPQKSRPVRDYLGAQSRYASLQEHEIAELQREVDTGWERLQNKAKRLETNG